MKALRVTAVGMIAMLGISLASAETKYLNAGTIVKGELPFSEAVKVDNTLYLSGQVGIVPETQKLIAGGIEAESRQTMKNIKSVAEAYGYSMSDMVKCTVFLADLKEWGIFNDVYKSFYTAGMYPARSAVEVKGLALDSRVEVECMATKS